MKLHANARVVRRSPLALAVALAFAAGAASAQPLFSAPWYGKADMSAYADNYVEITPVYVDGGNAKFGEWTGLHKDGAYGLLNFNAAQSAANGLARGVSGWNLGVSSGMAAASLAQPGKWWLDGRYQGITHYVADDARLFAPNPVNQYAPPVQVGVEDVELKRQTYGLGGGFAFLGNWKGFVDLSQTERKGNQMAGGAFAYKSFNALAPVDDQTQQLSAGLRYAADALQAELAYRLSTYRNQVANSSYQVGGKTFSLAPDNDWSQISAKGAYAISPMTQLLGTVAYSWSTQDAAFSSSPVGTTRTSLNGEVAQTLVDLSLNSRVTSTLRLKANYHYLDRDNKTESFAFKGSPMYAPDGFFMSVRNLTPSSTSQRATVEGTYDLARLTKLRAWYQYKDTDYSPVEQALRTGSKNNQFGLELNSNASDLVTGLLRYQYDKRSGGEYRVNAMTDWMYAYKDLSTLRQYWMADYEENLVRGQVHFAPADTVAVQVSADWARRDYASDVCGGGVAAGADTICLGLNQTDRQAITLDTQFTPSEAINLFAFYTWSRIQQDQASNSSASLAPTGRWSAASAVADHTIGAGGEWKLNERWTLGSQLSWVNGTEKYDMSGTNGAGKPLVQYPENKYTETTLQLYGSWKYSKTLSLRANYEYSRLRSDNWAFEGSGIAVGSPINQTYGLDAPYFKTHLVALTANLRFW